MGAYETADILFFNFFNGVYKHPIGTIILLASVLEEGHIFQEKRTPSRSSASTKSQPDILLQGGGCGVVVVGGDIRIYLLINDMPRCHDLCGTVVILQILVTYLLKNLQITTPLIITSLPC